MQFLVIGRDYTDEKALERRMNCREDHLKAAGKKVEEGILIYAGALLNDDHQMIGSMMVVDYPSRKEVEEWLNEEPYVLGNVWEEIEIRPFAEAPFWTK